MCSPLGTRSFAGLLGFPFFRSNWFKLSSGLLIHSQRFLVDILSLSPVFPHLKKKLYLSDYPIKKAEYQRIDAFKVWC